MNRVAKLNVETTLEGHFQFGQNWSRLIDEINSQKLDAATRDMAGFLGRLDGKDFLDIGCGSGLSSLAAYTLGANAITSIDIDPLNIENT